VAFLLPDTVPTANNRRIRRGIERLDAVVTGIVAGRAGAAGDRDDLLSMLMRANPDGAGTSSNSRQLRDEVMSFLLAGHESSAVALAWTWHLLAGHPDVEQRLVAELDGVLNGRLPAADDAPNLPYTNCVLLESMRLFPPVPLMGREAIHDCDIGGFPVRRGELVIASQWVMHRDARYFASPQAFDPGRWETGLLDTLSRYVYFPFGAGPRVCIGRSFAMMELTLLLATMAQAVSLTRVDQNPIVVASSSLFSKHGIKMKVRLRQSSPTRM
jgi:cytochrome P450